MISNQERNPEFRAWGTELQTVTRCVCGHIYEYHYVVGDLGQPGFNRDDANRCPAEFAGCECKRVEWDGAPPPQAESCAVGAADNESSL